MRRWSEPRSNVELGGIEPELSLASLWRQRGLDMAAASARAQLLCLDECLGDAQVAADARFA